MKNIPSPSLQDVIAARYRHIPLPTAQREMLQELQMVLYKAAAKASLATNVGDAYAVLMDADIEMKRALSAVAESIRTAA